jgi:probable F420-dependent oxidoreductase
MPRKERKVKFWQATAFADADQMIKLAPAAEELGFHGIAVSDHLFFPERLSSPYPYTPDGKPYWQPGTHWPDAWVLVGGMAAVTSRLHFTTYSYVLPLRNVFVVAKAVGTAAVLSGDRVTLGAAAGWMREEFEQSGQDFESRGKRFDEMIEVLRALWGGDMVEHHGRYLDFDRLQMSPAPTRPVPITVAGHSKAALRRAARLGDGWDGIYTTVEELLELVEQLKALRKEFGREGEPFEVTAALLQEPDPDTCRRLEDAGVSGLVTSAWMMAGGDTSTVEAKRKALEDFAERYIAPLR